MGQSIIQVDAFTDQPFRGNPAAVCVMEQDADVAWMQRVALEMNLSETAFLYPHGDGYHLRWYTPVKEALLCGHATLATAHVLWEEGHLPTTEIARFHTRSGLLTARRSDGWIELNFPAHDVAPHAAPQALQEALEVEAVAVSTGTQYDLVEVAEARIVRSITPNLTSVAAASSRGVIVTAAGDDGTHDFISRMFAPHSGIPEDPVTGSAHCYLAPYWAKKLGKTTFAAYQASARGGELRIRLEGDRVVLAGQAVTTMRGELV